jgi:hypothetical protein
VIVREVLSTNDAMHISFHELLSDAVQLAFLHFRLIYKLRVLQMYLNEINFRETVVAPWFLNVQDWDDIFMVEISQ